MVEQAASLAADDAPGWVPRGSGYHRPHGVGLEAVALTPVKAPIRNSARPSLLTSQWG